MKSGVRIILAVGVGYLLGRTRKLRLALTLAGIGASGRLRGGPAGLVKQGTKLLGSSPELKTLSETVRGRLVEAGRTAAMTAASGQIDALSDRIEERTRSLTRPPIPGRAAPDEEQTGDVRGRPAWEAEEEPRGDGEQRPLRRRRRPETDIVDDEEAEGAEEAMEGRPRRRPAPPRESPVRRRRPFAEESAEEERPRRSARPVGRSPVRRMHREEPES